MATNEATENPQIDSKHKILSACRWQLSLKLLFLSRAAVFLANRFFPQSSRVNQIKLRLALAKLQSTFHYSRSLCVHSKDILLRRTSTSTFSYRSFIKKTGDNRDNDWHHLQPAQDTNIRKVNGSLPLSCQTHIPAPLENVLLVCGFWRSLQRSRSRVQRPIGREKNVSQLKMQTHDDGVTVHGAISFLFIPRGCFIINERKTCLRLVFSFSSVPPKPLNASWRWRDVRREMKRRRNEVGSILNERKSTRSDLWRRIMDWVAFLPVSQEFHELSDFLSRLVVYKKIWFYDLSD